MLEQDLKSLLIGKRLHELLVLLRNSVCSVTHSDEELLARDRDFRAPRACMNAVIRTKDGLSEPVNGQGFPIFGGGAAPMARLGTMSRSPEPFSWRGLLEVPANPAIIAALSAQYSVGAMRSRNFRDRANASTLPRNSLLQATPPTQAIDSGAH